MSASPEKAASPCSLCGSGDGRAVARHDGYGMILCTACGLVYVDPRPAPGELAALYAGYHARNGQDEASWKRLMEGVFRESAALLRPAPGEGGAGRLLDVGCGFGSFVALMRRRGWDAEGIDPSAAAVAAATRAGLPVRFGTLEDVDASSGSFDAVTLFYVLEHLPEPLAALRKIHGLLKPGGTILLRVPHTTPIVRFLSPFGAGGGLFDPPFHLYDFSPRVLARMLAETGFAGVRTFPGRPTIPSRPVPRVVSVVCGAVAAGLHRASRGKLLLPGVSKTTVAGKPA